MVKEQVVYIDPTTGQTQLNNPTSWYWNIRVGDKLQINGSGLWYTVVGPMVVTPQGGNAGSGGMWEFDTAGKPILQRTETAGVIVTVPRGPMPAQGWPIVHFIRTGGGGNRPLVDRGPQAANDRT